MYWTKEQPKSTKKQVVSYQPHYTLYRKPFNGTVCEKWCFLLEDGTIWYFYRNKNHAIWQRTL